MARVRHSTSSSEDVPGTCAAVVGTTTKPPPAHMPGNTGAVRATTSTPPTVACDFPVLAAMASPHTGGSPFGSPTSAPSSAESRSGSPRAGFAHHGHSPRHHAATVIQAKQRQVAAKRRVAELKAAHDAVTACESDWAKAQQQAATRIQRAARRQHDQQPRRQQPTPPSLQPVPPQPAQGSVNVTVESPSPRRTLTVVSHDTVGTRAPARRELFPETAQPPAPTKASAVRAPEAVHDGSDAPSLVAAPPASRRTRGQEPVEGPGQVHTSPVMHRGRRIKTKGTGTSCGSSTASSVASKNRSRPRGRDRQARARTRHRDTARDVSADSTPPQHKLDVDGSAGRRYRSFVVDDAASSGDEAAGARPARQSQPTVTPRTSHGRHSSCASSVSDGTSATAQSARSVASSNARGRASAAHTYQRLYQASQAKLKVLRAKHERESAQSAALRKEVAALQAQHDRDYTAAQELRGQVDVLEKANKAMATRNHKLRKEVASLRATMASSRASFKLQAATQRRATLQETEDLRAVVEDLTRERDAMAAEVLRLRSQLQDKAMRKAFDRAFGEPEEAREVRKPAAPSQPAVKRTTSFSTGGRQGGGTRLMRSTQSFRNPRSRVRLIRHVASLRKAVARPGRQERVAASTTASHGAARMQSLPADERGDRAGGEAVVVPIGMAGAPSAAMQVDEPILEELVDGFVVEHASDGGDSDDSSSDDSDCDDQ